MFCYTCDKYQTDKNRVGKQGFEVSVTKSKEQTMLESEEFILSSDRIVTNTKVLMRHFNCNGIMYMQNQNDIYSIND